MNDPSVLSGAGSESTIASPTRLAAESVLRPILAACQADAGNLDSHSAQIIHLVPVPICVCDAAGRITFANRAAGDLLGWGVPLSGEPNPGFAWFAPQPREGSVIPFVTHPLATALDEGKAFKDLDLVLSQAGGGRLDASVTIEPLRDAGGAVAGAIIVVVDVSERRRRERHGALIAKLGQKLTTTNDEAEIVRVATCLVGQSLGVQRCGFVENESGAGTVKVIPGWIRDPVPSLVGRHEIQALGDAEWQRTLGSARLAIDDVTEHPQTRQFAEAYGARGIRAYAGVPFVRDGHWVSSLTVTSDQPRGWTSDDLSLLDEVLARVWPLVERARAQAALQLVTANAPVVLSYFDRECRIVFANQAFAARWGAEPSEFVGKHLADIIGKEGFEAVRPQIDKVLGGEPVQFEVEVPYRGLGRRFVRVSCAPDGDREHGIRGFLSAVSDMTDRRQMEQALRDSEERYRELIRTLPVGLYVCDEQGQVVLFNDAAAELWGRRPQLGKESWGGAFVAYGDDGAAIPRESWPLARAYRQGTTPAPQEVQVERPDGSRRHVVSHPQLIRDEAGKVTGGMNVLVDVTESKQAELARKESEERFRTLAEHAPVGIFQTNPRGECTFVNEYWCRLASLEAPDALGMGWMSAVHPDDRARVAAAWQAAVANGSPFLQEHRLLRTDGTVTWVQASGVEFRDDRGRLVGHLGTVVDISERKINEFALRESEKRFRLVASRAPVGIFMTNPQGETVFVNASWCSMAGVTAEEAEGLRWAEVLHPDDRERVIAEWQEAVRQGVSSKAEYRFVRRDGKVIWVNGAAVQIRDANGRLTGYIGTVADFTERKEAEIALRESEERFRHLADNIAQFAWICDANGDPVWVNRRLLEYVGAKSGAEGFRLVQEMHHPDHQDRVAVKYREHIASGAPWEDSFPLRGCDGTYRWFLSRATPIRDAAGRITRWFGTNTDITDLRDTQEMLRKTQEELLAHTGDLERKVEARTASLRDAIVQMEEFSYSVSHDLRAPLRAMNTYAEVLMEDYGPRLDDTARDYLRRIQRSSQRMEKLTHDVLTYSRLARTEIVPTSVDLEAVLRDLVSQYAELQPGAADFTVDEPLQRVRGHELSVGQCLGNLLTNAAKFVLPGTRPRIRVRTTVAQEIVRVWVEDNGIGIPPEHQRNLFQMFERVPTTTPYEGTGIGLAIVRKAVEKMGGRYGVESDGATGSRFWIELPKG